MPKREKPERLYTVAEVVELLRVPRSTLYAWRGSGRGPRGFRMGRRVFFAESDLMEFIERTRESDVIGQRVSPWIHR